MYTMSTTSHKKSKSDFEVLKDQDVELTSDNHLHHVKLHRIHGKPSTTQDLSDSIHTGQKNVPQVSPFAKVTDFVKESPMPEDGFKSAMREVLHYVKGISEKKKAKILAFDLSVFESSEDYDRVVEILSSALKNGTLTKPEHAGILDIIKEFGNKREEKKSEKSEIVEKDTEPEEQMDYVGIERIKNYSKDSLPELREEYISEYIKWEEKSRHGKKMFSKTMGSLGGNRPLPARLTQKHSELDIAEKEYNSLLNKISVAMSSEEKLEFLINERTSLSEEINSRRGEKERKIISSGSKVWQKTDVSEKIIISSALLSGDAQSISFSTSVSHGGFEGYRAPRSAPEKATNSATEAGDISEKLARFIEKQNERKQNLVQPVSEAKVSAKEPAKAKSGFFSSFKKALGLDEVEVKKNISLVKTENLSVSLPKKEEESGISDSILTLSNRIPFHNGVIDIVDTGVAKKVLLNNMEIASEVPLGEGNIICLFDKYQNGREFSNIREAFNIAFDNTFALENKAEVIEEIPFEAGKIAVLVGFPDQSSSVKILLNGKEIARGKMGNKGPEVGLVEVEGVKSGWLMADTVYERAFKKAIPVLKKLK